MRVEKNNVLDDNIGFIHLNDSMGNDLTIVNSARVSFQKRKDLMDKSDIGLVKYLAENKHWSPFRHVMLQFHVKAPEIVGRQWYKHVIGSDYTFKDHAWNEVSGRYVVYDEEFYIPTKLRKQSEDNKQASMDEEPEDHDLSRGKYVDSLQRSYNVYRELIEMGVSKEQARGVLPVSFYTEWYWTASLQAVMNFIQLRDHEHAQWEIQQYARAMKELILPVAPIGIAALLENA